MNTRLIKLSAFWCSLFVIAIATIGVALSNQDLYTPQLDWQNPSRPLHLKIHPETQLAYVEVRINNVPCNMLIDTGAVNSFLHQDFVDKHFPDAPKQPIQVGSDVFIDTTMFLIDQLSVEDIVTMKSFMIISLDLSAVRELIPIDGILGLNTLGAAPFIFSPSKQTFQWYPSQNPDLNQFSPARMYRGLNGFVLVRSKIQNKEVDWILDTGATYTSIQPYLWPPGESKHHQILLQRATSTASQSYTKTIKKGESAPIVLSDKIKFSNISPLLIDLKGENLPHTAFLT